MANRDKLVDYSNKRSITGIEPADDEVLVPILAYELVQSIDSCVKEGIIKANDIFIKENLETWHLGGRKILVGYIPVPKEKALRFVDWFWSDVNSYLDSTKMKRCYISNNKGELIHCPKDKKCSECKRNGNPDNIYSLTSSLDQFLENIDSDDRPGWDPTGTNVYEEASYFIEEIKEMIQIVNEKYEYGGKILNLLAEGFSKKEILERINLGKKKSQGYEHIKEIQQYAKEVYIKIHNGDEE